MKSRSKQVNIVFWVSAVTVLFFVLLGIMFPKGFANGAEAAFQFTTENFGWFYLLSVLAMVIFSLYMAFSKFGKIRLGGDQEKPQFSRFTWIAMLFSCGLGIALVFYGVGEPMTHFFNPPSEDITSQSAEAARIAMGQAFFHYGLSMWAIFAVVGLAIAYFQFRKKKNGLISTSLQPLMPKNRSSRSIKNTINILAIVATVMGVATSVGMGVLQTNGGLNAVFNTPIHFWVQLAIIAIMTLLFLLSSTSGLNKGIKWLSNANLALAILLMIFVFFAGPTVFIMETFTVAIGDYISNFISYSLNMTPYSGEHWVHEWTIFYWAWTIAWSPFVGAFFARISRGRTIREFIIGVMVAPALLSMMWMAVFGGTSLYMDLFKGSNIATVTNNDITLAIFTLFETLPITEILSVVTIILIFTFLITSADSAAYILSSMSENGSTNPPIGMRIVWGVLISSIALVLLSTSGLTGLQSASLVAALPFTVIIVFMMISLVKVVSKEVAPKAEKQKVKVKEKQVKPVKTGMKKKKEQDVLSV
jgi:glycine betaine transporter